MNVLLSQTAQDDLRAIRDYAAAIDTRAAFQLLDELEIKIASLSENALFFGYVAGHKSKGIRQYVYKQYRIIYHVQSNVVEMLHILHHARDVKSMLAS